MAAKRAVLCVVWTTAALLGARLVLAGPAGESGVGTERVVQFWRESAAELDAFAPDYVVDGGCGRLWFRGWHDRWWEVRWWAGSSMLAGVVAIAHVPEGWEPPDDGRTWLVIEPDEWTSSGLPDARAYCLREQALAAVQAGRVIGRMYRRPGRMILVAEGMWCAAALAAACAEPERVGGLVLIDPRPYRHLDGGGTGLSGAEAAGLERLVREHPEWLADLRNATRLYDIASVGPAVSVPVVAIADMRRWPQWLDVARERGGWYCIGVDA
ncbi:MAG: hypothetical protein N2512_04515, partial [Armatimonadetes bacterium]|nr:hypothetical protein [Armatimonadota bacterium]